LAVSRDPPTPFATPGSDGQSALGTRPINSAIKRREDRPLPSAQPSPTVRVNQGSEGNKVWRFRLMHHPLKHHPGRPRLCRECGHPIPSTKSDGLHAFFCSIQCCVPAAFWAANRKGYGSPQYVTAIRATKKSAA
jgi:hypothetical protein